MSRTVGTTNEKVARDELAIIDFMLSHKGIENAVSSKELTCYLAEIGVEIHKTSAMHKLTRLAIERHLPICHDNKLGYYWATSKQDILHSIDDLQKRIDSLQNRIDHLRSFMF